MPNFFNSKKKPNNTNNKNPSPQWSSVYYIAIIVILLGIQFSVFLSNNSIEISYSKFRNLAKQGKIESVEISPTTLYGKLKKEYNLDDHVSNQPSSGLKAFSFSNKNIKDFHTYVVNDNKLIELLEKHKITYQGTKDGAWFGELFQWILPFTILLLIYFFVFRKMNFSSHAITIGKSKASMYEPSRSFPKTTFKDVAGLSEAKEEVMEVVDFLKDPKRFTRLGGKLPKGVLLIGPPGTGKTLMAKAVAGEAGVPFFSLSGSDFVEMFVGVGAARVRDLFKRAKEKGPCIIFIDEIDAVGRSRGKGLAMGTNDERESTLNQLLVEMDGFATDSGVILMAATNRPDVLDSALLRPGRFDRQISIDKPDLNGRIEILKVHTKKISFDPNIDLRSLASQMPGFAGAEIANVCNEAALLASRRNKKIIEHSDFQDAIERVIAGLEKKNKVISPKEKIIVAYHESGHAVVSWMLPPNDPVQKVSIIPRGTAALGYTINIPLEDRYLMTKDELFARMCGLLGGRIAEEIVFNQISTGAQNDLEKVTEIAYNMVTTYGMSEKVGYISLSNESNKYLYGYPKKEFSDKTVNLIDSETKRLIEEASKKTREILTAYRDALDTMSQELLTKEVLFYHDIENILGKRKEDTATLEKKTG